MKLVMALESQGVDVDILTIDPKTFASPGELTLDEELLQRAPAVGEHLIVRSPETSFRVRLAKKLDKSRRLTHRWLEPKKREWTGPALRALRERDISSYDAVLTCSQPHCNHLVGLELQQQHGIPWLAYFSDPWTDSPYIQYADEKVRQFNRRLEDRILERADRVLYTCPEMRDLIVDRHPVLDREKTGVLPHAFVADWYPDEPQSLDESFSGVSILHTGSFYGPRTPLPLVRALSRLRQDGVGLEGLRIESYGGMDPAHRQRIETEGLSDVFRVHGYLPYLQTLPLMRAHDRLLVLDAPVTQSSENVFLPSKLIDYLGAGRPILALTPDRGATARVVREVGGTVCPLEDEPRIDAALFDLIAGSDASRPGDTEAADRYEHRQVGARARAELERTLR
jgi:hypothetical protein